MAVVALTIAIDNITGRIDSITSAFWYNIDLCILLVFATVIVIESIFNLFYKKEIDAKYVKCDKFYI